MATGAGAGRKQVGALQLQLCGSGRRFVHKVDVGFSAAFLRRYIFIALLGCAEARPQPNELDQID